MYEDQSIIFDHRAGQAVELNTTRDLNKFSSGMVDDSLISNFRKTEADFDTKQLESTTFQDYLNGLVDETPKNTQLDCSEV